MDGLNVEHSTFIVEIEKADEELIADPSLRHGNTCHSEGAERPKNRRILVGGIWQSGIYDLGEWNWDELPKVSSAGFRLTPSWYTTHYIIVGDATEGSIACLGENRVRISVFDLGGREVRSLEHQALAQGRYQIVWDGLDARGRPVSSGAYICSAHGDADRASVRIVMMQ